MPSRHATAQHDLDFVVDLNCDPDITPAQHAEARKMLVAAMGTVGLLVVSRRLDKLLLK